MLSEQFPYIPCTNHPHRLIKIDELPSQIVAFDNGKNRCHFAKREIMFEEYSRKKAKCLCGREAKDLLRERYVVSAFCNDCLSKFNEIMKESIYDESENRFFLIE